MTQRQLRELYQPDILSDTPDFDCVLSFYLGKKVAFVYRAQREVRGTKIRVIWGKITRPHGAQTQACFAFIDPITELRLQATLGS